MGYRCILDVKIIGIWWIPEVTFEDEFYKKKSERINKRSKDRITYLRDSKGLRSLERDGKGRSIKIKIKS